MAGVVPKFTTGPVTYKSGEKIVGGQVVEARANGVVGVAAAGSTKVLGVATRDAIPAADRPGETTDIFGNPVYSDVEYGEYVAVGVGFYPVAYDAPAEFGQALIAAADGAVTPAAAAADAQTIIGYCAEVNGVAAPGVALAKISR